jgi:hypothetical protein
VIRKGSDKRIRLELDDVTVEHLQAAADARDIELDELLAQLLVAASGHIDELLSAD